MLSATCRSAIQKTSYLSHIHWLEVYFFVICVKSIVLPQAIPLKTFVIVDRVNCRSRQLMVRVCSRKMTSEAHLRKEALEKPGREDRRRGVLLGGHIPQTTRVTTTGLGPLIGYNRCNSVKWGIVSVSKQLPVCCRTKEL